MHVVPRISQVEASDVEGDLSPGVQQPTRSRTAAPRGETPGGRFRGRVGRYILIDVDLLSHWLAAPPHSRLRVWLEILSMAAWRDHRWQGFELKRGQLLTSERDLARRTKASRKVVREVTKHCVMSGALRAHSGAHLGRLQLTLYTVVNYEAYQAGPTSGPAPGPPRAHLGPTEVFRDSSSSTEPTDQDFALQPQNGEQKPKRSRPLSKVQRHVSESWSARHGGTPFVWDSNAKAQLTRMEKQYGDLTTIDMWETYLQDDYWGERRYPISGFYSQRNKWVPKATKSVSNHADWLWYCPNDACEMSRRPVRAPAGEDHSTGVCFSCQTYGKTRKKPNSKPASNESSNATRSRA